MCSFSICIVGPLIKLGILLHVLQPLVSKMLTSYRSMYVKEEGKTEPADVSKNHNKNIGPAYLNLYFVTFQ